MCIEKEQNIVRHRGVKSENSAAITNSAKNVLQCELCGEFLIIELHSENTNEHQIEFRAS